MVQHQGYSTGCTRKAKTVQSCTRQRFDRARGLSRRKSQSQDEQRHISKGEGEGLRGGPASIQKRYLGRPPQAQGPSEPSALVVTRRGGFLRLRPLRSGAAELELQGVRPRATCRLAASASQKGSQRCRQRERDFRG